MIKYRNFKEYNTDSFDYTEEQAKYAACMSEIKKRMYNIKDRLSQGTTPLKALFDTEYICLQFRSIIELIALASLAAQKKQYTKGAEKLKKEWRAKAIIQYLKNINPHFYPTPVEILDNGDIISNENDYLTINDFLEVYDSCSDYLHVQNPFGSPHNFDIYGKFIAWWYKIEQLIAAHIIQLVESNKKLFTVVYFQKEMIRDVYVVYLIEPQSPTFK